MDYFILLLRNRVWSRILSHCPGDDGNSHCHSDLLLSFRNPFPLYEITLIAFFFLSVWISENAEIFFGKKDDGRIVIDEMIGFFITMLWIPKTLSFIILGFFLFRFFDILKPFPIRRMERPLKGGYGVVLDDVASRGLCQYRSSPHSKFDMGGFIHEVRENHRRSLREKRDGHSPLQSPVPED